MTKENPNHIYYANRANCKMEIFDYEGCFIDTQEAMKIDKTYIKSYIR